MSLFNRIFHNIDQELELEEGAQYYKKSNTSTTTTPNQFKLHDDGFFYISDSNRSSLSTFNHSKVFNPYYIYSKNDQLDSTNQTTTTLPSATSSEKSIIIREKITKPVQPSSTVTVSNKRLSDLILDKSKSVSTPSLYPLSDIKAEIANQEENKFKKSKKKNSIKLPKKPNAGEGHNDHKLKKFVKKIFC
jgi:hypothetical protein